MKENWKKASAVLMGIFTANPSITDEEKQQLDAAVAEDALALGAKAPSKEYAALTALAGVVVGSAELTEDAVGVSEASLDALEVKVGELTASVEVANTGLVASTEKAVALEASVTDLTTKLTAANTAADGFKAEIETFKKGIRSESNTDVSGDTSETIDPVAAGKAKAAADKKALADKGWGDMVR